MAPQATSSWPEGKPPANCDDFFQCLEASGVLGADPARQVLLRLLDRELHTADPATLATALHKAGKLTKLQARSLLAGKIKYLTFSDYVILEKLGQGGMGTVYKAEHRRMKRIVALKLLAPNMLKNPDAIRRFEREVQTAAKLIHPNIVTAFDANEKQGVHYFVMEYVAGRDLNSLLNERGTLPLATAVDYVLQAARGLAYAHRQGVVHRDVKPANLLVDSQGHVKVLDMGLARLHHQQNASQELTETGQIMGTIDYMAPEQAEDTRSADARSDVYSLGCTLYRLVRGETMYGGDTVVSKLLAHRSAPIPPLLIQSSPREADLPARLNPIFNKMVAKRPEDRPANMEEVIVALETWLNDYRQVASAPRGLEPTTDFKAVGSTNSSAEPLLNLDVKPSLTSPTRLQRTRQRRVVPKWLYGAVAGGLLGLALLAAGVVMFFSTSQGTIRVEINDPSIEVTVAESGYKIKGQTEEITLKPGEQTLHVKSGELEFDTRKFVLGKGDNPALVVELLPGEVRVVQSGKVLGSKPRAKKTPPVVPPTEPTLEERMAKMPSIEVDGDWHMQNGALTANVAEPKRMCYLYFGDPAWTDYDVESTVTFHERWPSESGLVARCDAPKRWQYIVGGFADMRNRDLLPFTTLDDAWGSKGRRFAAEQERLMPGSTHTLRLRVRGNTATSFLDGVQIAASEDDHIRTGRAGICSFGNTLFKDIEVRSPDGKLLWKGLPKVDKPKITNE